MSTPLPSNSTLPLRLPVRRGKGQGERTCTKAHGFKHHGWGLQLCNTEDARGVWQTDKQTDLPRIIKIVDFPETDVPPRPVNHGLFPLNIFLTQMFSHAFYVPRTKPAINYYQSQRQAWAEIPYRVHLQMQLRLWSSGGSSPQYLGGHGLLPIGERDSVSL